MSRSVFINDYFSCSNNKFIINFYKSMYNSYKHRIGGTTTAGNIITEKMVENMKKRMLELMGRDYE